MCTVYSFASPRYPGGASSANAPQDRQHDPAMWGGSQHGHDRTPRRNRVRR